MPPRASAELEAAVRRAGSSISDTALGKRLEVSNHQVRKIRERLGIERPARKSSAFGHPRTNAVDERVAAALADPDAVTRCARCGGSFRGSLASGRTWFQDHDCKSMPPDDPGSYRRADGYASGVPA